MGRIYRGASAVRIWLGNDAPGQRLTEALDILRRVYRLCVRFGWDLDFIYITIADDDLRKESGLPGIMDEAWRSIKQLLEMPWFCRTWVIQEVVLSREAYLHSDNTSLPWNEFCVGLLSLNHHFCFVRSDILPSLTVYAHVMELVLTYHKANNGRNKANLYLLTLLENHRLARATDPRDKIYAFLGIHEELTGNWIHGIASDYRVTTRDAYVEAATRIIQYTSSLDVLGVAGLGNKDVPGLPSWVPDWSARALVSPLSYKTLDGTYLYNFNAAGVTSCDDPDSVVLKGDLLQLRGFAFDEVVRVGDVADLLLRNKETELSITALIPHTLALVLSWFKVSGCLERGTERYPDGQSRIEAFIRTIFLDDVPDNVILQEAPEVCRIYSNPLRSLRQRWKGEFERRWFYQTLLWSTLLRLLGHSGVGLFARALRKLEDSVTLSFTVRMRYNPQGPLDEYEGQDEDAGLRIIFTRLRSLYRRLFVTERGYIGLGPQEMQVGDRVYLVRGSRTPLMFRAGDVGQWRLVGDCYVCGIMQGEAFDDEKCEQFVVV